MPQQADRRAQRDEQTQRYPGDSPQGRAHQRIEGPAQENYTACSLAAAEQGELSRLALFGDTDPSAALQLAHQIGLCALVRVAHLPRRLRRGSGRVGRCQLVFRPVTVLGVGRCGGRGERTPSAGGRRQRPRTGRSW